MIPYNPYVCKKYISHINLEVCLTIAAVKYLFKYICKGHDCTDIYISESNGRAMRPLSQHDVSEIEATRNIFGASVQHMSHSVEKLPLHAFGHFFENNHEEQAFQNATRAKHYYWRIIFPKLRFTS